MPPLVTLQAGRPIAPCAVMEEWDTPTFDEIRMDAELTSYVAERDELPAAEDE